MAHLRSLPWLLLKQDISLLKLAAPAQPDSLGQLGYLVLGFNQILGPGPRQVGEGGAGEGKDAAERTVSGSWANSKQGPSPLPDLLSLWD